MPGDRPMHLGSYLSKAFPIQTQDQIRAQSRLLTLIQSSLPPEAGSQCRHVVIRGSELRITVDSSSQASILRFHQPLLLEKLNPAGYPQVKILRIKVSPIELTGRAAIRGRPLPGRNTVKVIATAAVACQEPDIRNALTRLANTLEGLQSSAPVPGPDTSAPEGI